MPDQRALLLGRLASAIDGVADVASTPRRPGDRDQGAGSSEAASRVGWPALDPGSGHGADCHAGPRTRRPGRHDLSRVAPRRAASTPGAPPLQDAAGHHRIERDRAHPRLVGRGPLPERRSRPGTVRVHDADPAHRRPSPGVGPRCGRDDPGHPGVVPREDLGGRHRGQLRGAQRGRRPSTSS